MQGDSIWLSTHRNICVRKGLLDNQVLTIPASPRMESSTISCSVPPKGLQPPHHPRGLPREGTPGPVRPVPAFIPPPLATAASPPDWLARPGGLRRSAAAQRPQAAEVGPEAERPALPGAAKGAALRRGEERRGGEGGGPCEAGPPPDSPAGDQNWVITYPMWDLFIYYYYYFPLPLCHN